MDNNIQSKSCGRCKANIDCIAANIATCACSQVTLSADAVAYLKGTNYDCLCNQCLIAMNELAATVKQNQFPIKASEMVESIHYYVENGFFVFTELYHALRGKCCQSGCRHCAYGYKNS